MTDESGNEFVIQKSNTERDLGIHIDCCLNVSEHIYKITHEANSIMAVIRRTLHNLIVSALLYCSNRWYVHVWNMGCLYDFPLK